MWNIPAACRRSHFSLPCPPFSSFVHPPPNFCLPSVPFNIAHIFLFSSTVITPTSYQSVIRFPSEWLNVDGPAGVINMLTCLQSWRLDSVSASVSYRSVLIYNLSEVNPSPTYFYSSCSRNIIAGTSGSKSLIKTDKFFTIIFINKKRMILFHCKEAKWVNNSRIYSVHHIKIQVWFVLRHNLCQFEVITLWEPSPCCGGEVCVSLWTWELFCLEPGAPGVSQGKLVSYDSINSTEDAPVGTEGLSASLTGLGPDLPQGLNEHSPKKQGGAPIIDTPPMIPTAGPDVLQLGW